MAKFYHNQSDGHHDLNALIYIHNVHVKSGFIIGEVIYVPGGTHARAGRSTFRLCPSRETVAGFMEIWPETCDRGGTDGA